MSSGLSRRQVAFNYGALLTGTSLARLLAGVALIIVANRVGPAAYGTMAGVMALAKITSVAFALGLEGWLLRNGFNEGRRDLLVRRSTAALAITAGLGIVWFAALALAAPWLDQNAFPFVLLLLAAATVYFEEIVNVVATSFKSALQNRTTFLLMLAVQATLLAGVVALALAGVQQVTPYMGTRALLLGASAAAAVYYLSHATGLALRRDDVRTTLLAAPPFALSLLLNLLYERADIVIVNSMLPADQAGLYATASTLVTYLFVVPGTILLVALPALSRLYTLEPERLTRTIRQMMLLSVGLAIALGLAVWLAAPLVVRLLYGPDFAPAAGVLAILSGVVAFRCISVALASVIVAVGWQARRLIPQAIAAVVSIVVNIAVLNRGGGILDVARIYVLSDGVLMAGYLAIVLLWWRTDRRAHPPALVNP